jgi:hypothetical protein
VATAHDRFARAGELAAGLGARSYELRSALSLVRLSRERGGAIDEAASRLRRVLATFGEGADTADQREARALLG